MTPQAQAEILNRLPEVRWDRTAAGEVGVCDLCRGSGVINTVDPNGEPNPRICPRCAGAAQTGFRTVFGWVDRPGSVRADFVVIIFDGEDVAFVTSSVLHSEDFTRRIFGDVGPHAPCIPVEDVFGELVPQVVRRARPLDSRILGQ